MKKRLILLGAVAAFAATASLLGGVLHEPSQASPAGSVPAAAPEILQGGFGAGDTASLVASLQAQLRTEPSTRGYALLGLAYQQRGRETGDPSYYPRSEGVLRRALALSPDDLLATSGLGSLALSRHRFRDALVIGRRAQRLSPTTARSYGIIGDSLIELGRYHEAFAAYDRMAALKPSLASYARISHARELLGDLPGATAAMKLALGAAIGQPEALAWTHVQLGKLYWTRGRVDAAVDEYRAALAGFPGYVFGLDALAQAEAARGRLARAIRLEREAVDAIPLPQFVAQLGDLYRTVGDRRRAREQYATIGVIEKLLRTNGVRTDLETALFDADHGKASIALARAARRARPSIDGDDVLAWTLANAGRCREALPYANLALRLGTHDALKLFHRAAIEACIGDRASARADARRALELNSHFSLLWSDEARRLAR